jgi:hypothetical protein
MNLEQAQRLEQNEDFKAFLAVLQEDANGLMEDLIYGKDMDEYVRTQCKIIVLRGVTVRLQHLLADLKPEAPATHQDGE